MSVAMTAVILGRVQMSVANPDALGPRRSAFPTLARSELSSSGRRPVGWTTEINLSRGFDAT